MGLPKPLGKAQRLGVSGLSLKRQSSVLQPPGALFGDSIPPPFRNACHSREECGLQDAVKIKTGVSPAHQLRHPHQFGSNRQGVGKRLPTDQDRLQPGKRLQEEGMAVFHYRLQSGLGERFMKVHPGRKDPEDVPHR
jgi:hypothetical protein